MFKKKSIMRLLPLLFLSAASTTQAIEINSMFIVADKDGKGVFTIKNTEEKRVYLTVSMSEIHVTEGEIVKVPYTRDNLLDWDIDVRPSKSVIDVGYSKDFFVQMKCGKDCPDEDQLFQLAFVPTPYFEPEKMPKQAVQMAIGFGAFFLKPGEDKPISYQANYQSDGVVLIKNLGKSYLRALLDNCDDNVKQDAIGECKKSVHVMPGRELRVGLPEQMQKKPFVDLTLKTNEEKYIEQTRVVIGKH